MDLTAALEYLDSFINYEKENAVYPDAFKLERMRALVRELGNPQNAFESVIIAGSKGKGSTAAILSSILRMENLRVGLYTSPHLLHVSERIQVNGLCINEIRLAENLTRIQKATEGYVWRKNPPTYFEVLTALAFCHFKDMKIQVAVLEVGLGGLYDSTNVANAKVAGIAPISLEHTDKLGKTLSKIAVQKCGVIKGRETVIAAVQPPEAQSVIESACEDREAKLYTVGKEIKVMEREFNEDSQCFDIRTPWGGFYDLKIHLRGMHQIQNAAQAIGLAKALGEKARLPVSDEAVRQGVLDAHWPGRLEKFGDRPCVVLDGAHNVDSARKMLEGVRRHFQFEKLVVIFGSSADKDVRGMLDEIAAEADSLVLTQAAHPRAMPVGQIARLMESGKQEVYEEPSAAGALKKARFLAGSGGLVVVTGSLYVVAEARRLL